MGDHVATTSIDGGLGLGVGAQQTREAVVRRHIVELVEDLGADERAHRDTQLTQVAEEAGDVPAVAGARARVSTNGAVTSIAIGLLMRVSDTARRPDTDVVALEDAPTQVVPR